MIAVTKAPKATPFKGLLEMCIRDRGSAVPVTGFANGITSAALEYRSEGFVLGVGCNMFKIAGPVIVYGVVASFIAALIQLAYTAIMGMGV